VKPGLGWVLFPRQIHVWQSREQSQSLGKSSSRKILFTLRG